MTKKQFTPHTIYPQAYQTLKTKTRLQLVCNDCGKPIRINDFFLLDDFKNFAGFNCQQCNQNNTLAIHETQKIPDD